jgi:SAM-dependent methyltransferase
MNSATAQRLIELNRDFYDRFGDDFSATRQRLQPGVNRLVDTLDGGESVLDLGCGNGELARALARCAHGGSYLGLDFSLPLLADASDIPTGFPAKFIKADLTLPNWDADIRNSVFDLVTCFAAIHHLPSRELRLQFLQTIRSLLAPHGRFLLSTWQFLNSEKLRARLQPWERIGLTSADVDAGDHLLDWKRGGEGLRYVHQYSEEELASLADECGFEVLDTFYSDGEGSRLGLYQEWRKSEHGLQG